MARVHATLDRVAWPAIRARVFGRIIPLHGIAVAHRRKGGIDVYTEPARFVAPRVLEVGGEQLTAEQIVVAAGRGRSSRQSLGSTRRFHTSDTIMRIDEVRASLLVIGGGFIAAELATVSARSAPT